MVLRHRFPNVSLQEEISELYTLPKEVEIVCAGFPCQNLSMAGDKSGIKGDKSNIVEELFRLLEKQRVPLVVIENVYFMLHLKKGAAIHHIIEHFEELGYYWAYRVVDTRGFGLAQRRRRVFIVAATDIDPRNILLADDATEPTLAYTQSHETNRLLLDRRKFWTRINGETPFHRSRQDPDLQSHQPQRFSCRMAV